MAEKISRACVDDDVTGDDVGYLSTGSGAVLIGRNSRKLTNLDEDITSTNHIVRPIDMHTNSNVYFHSYPRRLSTSSDCKMLTPTVRPDMAVPS
jgi:hypothetical protein